MSTHYQQMRTDFRCAICQRKNVFHCEHDTPHRDRFLGADVPETFRMDDNPRRLSKTGNQIHNNENDTRQRVGSHTSARYHQEQRSDMNGYKSSQTHQTNQKSKSCVIL
ncbi:hypothetical protein I4U23_013478 [Adineta vaga]|nr:hypothetical protein I4U23_013478 [Adineta vaga]